MTQGMRFQVINTAIRVTKREFRQFHTHGIDGKIAPECGFFKTQFFVGMHHETAVTTADFTFGARERKIERQTLHGQVNHAESLAHQIRTAIL